MAVVAGAGYFGPLWQAKTEGAKRLLGLIQSTGFNRLGSTSLTGRPTAEAGHFGATYALLALAITALVLLRRGGPLQRMLALLQIAGRCPHRRNASLYGVIALLRLRCGLFAPRQRFGLPLHLFLQQFDCALARQHAMHLAVRCVEQHAVRPNQMALRRHQPCA